MPGVELVPQMLGLELKDIREWEVINIHTTLGELAFERTYKESMVFHYTNRETAQVILANGLGLRISRDGFRGGGLFFSTIGPVDKQLLAEHRDAKYKDVFEEFRARQLERNYGSDIGGGRERNVDAVLVCMVQSEFLEEVDPVHRPGAVFISKAKFSIVTPTEDGYQYFPLQKIVKAYVLGDTSLQRGELP